MRLKAIATPDGGVTQQLSTSEETIRDAEEAEWAAGQVSRDAKEEIRRLEGQVTNRRLREAHADPTWINAQEAKIATERAKL